MCSMCSHSVYTQTITSLATAPGLHVGVLAKHQKNEPIIQLKYHTNSCSETPPGSYRMASTVYKMGQHSCNRLSRTEHTSERFSEIFSELRQEDQNSKGKMAKVSKSKNTQHRLQLLELSQALTQCDLEELLFVCEVEISESAAEEIKSGTSFFRALEHRACLGPNNYEFLRTCLEGIGRNDLAHMLPEEDSGLAESISELSIASRSNCSPVVASKKKLLYIADQLRRKDLEKMSYLCSCECTMEGLRMIQELEKRGLIQDGDYSYLSELLMEIGRHDLGRMFTDTSKE